MNIKGWKLHWHFVKCSEYRPVGVFLYWEVYRLVNNEPHAWGEIHIGLDLFFWSVGIRCERD